METDLSKVFIRVECTEDHENVNILMDEAFLASGHHDGTELSYIINQRKKPSFVHELSLVATVNNKIVGQIMMTEMDCEGLNGSGNFLVISPLTVSPGCFRQGIGTKLLKESLKRARKLGYTAVFLCGLPKYYSRFGFVPTYKYDITHLKDTDGSAGWCLVKELKKNCLSRIKGQIDIE